MDSSTGQQAARLFRLLLPSPSLPRLAVMLPARVVAGRVLRWFRCAGMPSPLSGAEGVRWPQARWEPLAASHS
jgi:hypothetical protein